MTKKNIIIAIVSAIVLGAVLGLLIGLIGGFFHVQRREHFCQPGGV